LVEEDIFLMLLDSTLMRIASCIIDERALRAKSMAESMKKEKYMWCCIAIGMPCANTPCNSHTASKRL